MEVQLVTALLIGLVCMQNICASDALSESSFSNLNYPFPLSEDETEPLFEAHIGDRKPTSPALSESSFSNLKYPFLLSENEKEPLFEAHIGDRKPTSPDALSESSFSNLKYPFPLSENEKKLLFEVHIGDRKPTSPDALSENSFSNLKYPFPLSENETEPLYEAHIGDRKQTSPVTPVRKDFLYFANRRFLAYMNRNGSELRGFRLTNTSNAVAVDFDIRLGYMIWSDNAHKVIAAARFNGSGPVVLVNSSINATDGLAWDWVNQKLYWTDAKDKEIEVIDPLSTHRKLLISTGSLSIPRAIVVDPPKRRMYWTDCGTPAKIERASMDGTSREVLHSTGLVRPNALTLDYDNQILYWMDAFLKRLESSNADGSNRKLLSTTQLVHPFGISFFQKRLYWTDRQTNAIYSASVNRPTVVSVVKSGLRLDPMGISVVSAERQLSATNPCQPNNGGCSHMCLLSSAPGGRMCACPDGFDFQLAANGRDCIMPCRNGNIRLVGGKTAYEGRVEVCWKKTWGTVCDDDWSSFDAIVACRQLGFPTTGALALHNAPFGQGAAPIFLDDLLCTSRERKLVNCTHRGIGVHNCVHREDAGLRCPAPPASCTNGDIRLRDGRNRFEGRVEICNNNKWGTVCDDAWGTTDANVACRQLGFASTGAIARVRAFFGQGTGSILLDQVACTGTETRLVNCRSNPLGDHDCSHFEDAGVICRQI